MFADETENTPAGDAAEGAPPRAEPGGKSASGRNRALTAAETLLVTLRYQLYHNSWDEMAADLRERLEGKQYSEPLEQRVRLDLDLISALSSYERTHDLDLMDLVQQGAQA